MPKKKPAASTEPAPPSIEELIKPVSETEVPMCMLVYGVAGTGKTAFSSSFPKPMLVLDIQERGTETIAGVEGIQVLQVDTWEMLEQAYWYLESEGYKKYKTVSLDQITTLQSLRMNKLRKDTEMNATDTFTKRDWGIMSGDIQTWLLNFRNLRDKGVNVLFLAHERASSNDDTVDDQIAPSIGPRVMPSVASFINGATSQIGNCFIRETFEGAGPNRVRDVQYCMRVGPHAYYVTKIRKPLEADLIIPDVIINPTYDKLRNISRGVKPAPKRSVKRSLENGEANSTQEKVIG